MITRPWPQSPAGLAPVRQLARALGDRSLWLVLAAAPTLVFPGPWTAVGIILIVLAAASRGLAFGRPAVRTPLDVPIGLLALASGIGLAVSPLPSVSSAKLWGIVLGISVFYALVSQARHERWLARAVQAVIALGVLVAAVG